MNVCVRSGFFFFVFVLLNTASSNIYQNFFFFFSLNICVDNTCAQFQSDNIKRGVAISSINIKADFLSLSLSVSLSLPFSFYISLFLSLSFFVVTFLSIFFLVFVKFLCFYHIISLNHASFNVKPQGINEFRALYINIRCLWNNAMKIFHTFH